MEPPLAIIDLGTNTFHLLIAQESEQQTLSILHREQVPVKLMADGFEKGAISSAAYDRGMRAIATFKQQLQTYNAHLVKILGTSALRNATNAPKFLDEIKNDLDCPVSLIDGDQEASFIYEGARTAVNIGEQPALILDIGGGSVEFILGNRWECLWKQSLEIGAARLIRQFQHHFPVKETEKQAIQDYLADTLTDVLPVLQQYQPRLLIGASGFFETFVNLDRHQQEPVPSEPFPLSYHLSLSTFHSLKAQVLNKTEEELRQMPGMEDFRVPMMGVSTLLVDFLLKHLPFEAIQYSNFAMKEGALAGYIKGYANPEA